LFLCLVRSPLVSIDLTPASLKASRDRAIRGFLQINTNIR
jgi:hypothetical protein